MVSIIARGNRIEDKSELVFRSLDAFDQDIVTKKIQKHQMILLWWLLVAP